MKDKEFKEGVNKLIDEFNEKARNEMTLQYPMHLHIYNNAQAMSFEQFSEWLKDSIYVTEQRMKITKVIVKETL